MKKYMFLGLLFLFSSSVLAENSELKNGSNFLDYLKKNLVGKYCVLNPKKIKSRDFSIKQDGLIYNYSIKDLSIIKYYTLRFDINRVAFSSDRITIGSKNVSISKSDYNAFGKIDSFEISLKINNAVEAILSDTLSGTKGKAETICRILLLPFSDKSNLDEDKEIQGTSISKISNGVQDIVRRNIVNNTYFFRPNIIPTQSFKVIYNKKYISYYLKNINLLKYSELQFKIKDVKFSEAEILFVASEVGIKDGDRAKFGDIKSFELTIFLDQQMYELFSNITDEKEKANVIKEAILFPLSEKFRIFFENETFVGNAKSKCLHRFYCNHLPPDSQRIDFSSVADAKNKGFSLCQVCFFEIPNLEDYNLEKQLSIQSISFIKNNFVISTNDSINNIVLTKGRKVLEYWLYPLVGYKYNFLVIDDDLSFNAFACPQGYIFVTSGLLKIVEYDEELEAILAHEITHVENRHGLKQFKDRQKAGIISAVGSVLTSVLINKEEYVALFDIISSFVKEIVLAGYSRNNEEEADCYAMQYMRKHYNPYYIKNIYKKLQDFQNSIGYKRSSIFSTHPDLDERIRKIDTF